MKKLWLILFAYGWLDLIFFVLQSPLVLLASLISGGSCILLIVSTRFPKLLKIIGMFLCMIIYVTYQQWFTVETLVDGLNDKFEPVSTIWIRFYRSLDLGSTFLVIRFVTFVVLTSLAMWIVKKHRLESIYRN